MNLSDFNKDPKREYFFTRIWFIVFGLIELDKTGKR